MLAYIRRARRAAVVAIVPFVLGACFSGNAAHHRTSVVSYLYPSGRTSADTAGVATLRLPLKVGVAFVPPTPAAGGGYRFASQQETDVPEAERLRLTRQIADHFRARPFVKSVELIPSSYLTPGGGYRNLEQLRDMFGVDVMVLLAYDQQQFTGEGVATVAYWTIVGSYIVQGEKNTTHTLMDAVVVDVASRRLLFRAPGRSVVKGSATPVSLEEARRKDRLQGFALASADLATNLDAELAGFRDRVREAPDEIKVQRTAEYDRRVAASGGSGAGAVDPLTLLAVAGLALGGAAAARRRR